MFKNASESESLLTGFFCFVCLFVFCEEGGGGYHEYHEEYSDMLLILNVIQSRYTDSHLGM